MLLGDADRELLYETLKRHAAEGRLDVAELERRVALVAEAETREAAAEAMADLPPLDPGPARERRPGGARPRRGGEAGPRLAAHERAVSGYPHTAGDARVGRPGRQPPLHRRVRTGMSLTA